MAEAVVISGSEDGYLFAWDLLEGTVIERLDAHDGKVASAVAFNGARMEWASAGVDGEIFIVYPEWYLGVLPANLFSSGTVTIWGMP